MSVHVEWADAAHVQVEMVAAGEFADADTVTNDWPALLIGGDSVYVIEGKTDQIRRVLQDALAALDEFEATH